MSQLEDALAFYIKSLDLPEPVREYRFAAPDRQWRFDFAWPERMIAAEVEGGTFSRGRHVRPMGFEEDCKKYNAAAERGWRVFRFTTEMIRSGEAAYQLERVLQTISVSHQN